MDIKIYQPFAIHELGKRNNQEDSIFPFLGTADENTRLFILCDGMGGHEHGEVASQTISKEMAAYILHSLKPGDPMSDELLNAALTHAWQILDSRGNPESIKQMGTTLTLLYFSSNGCTVAHIGDSRIYHVRPAESRLLYKSRDHSLVYDLYQAGEISYEEMETSPQKNIITKAIVAHGDKNIKPDIVHVTNIEPGDYFYICSDGMLEQMSDDELVALFSSDASDEMKRNRLISETVDNKDNHSAYVVRVKEVSRSEEDIRMVDEELTARCNALNVKPISYTQPIVPISAPAEPVVEVAEISQPYAEPNVNAQGTNAQSVNISDGQMHPRGGCDYRNNKLSPRKKGMGTVIFLSVAVAAVVVAMVLFFTGVIKFDKKSREKDKDKTEDVKTVGKDNDKTSRERAIINGGTTDVQEDLIDAFEEIEEDRCEAAEDISKKRQQNPKINVKPADNKNADSKKTDANKTTDANTNGNSNKKNDNQSGQLDKLKDAQKKESSGTPQ